MHCVCLFSLSFICSTHCFFFLMRRRPPRSTRTDTLFPYTTLFRSSPAGLDGKVNLDIPSIGRLAAWLGQPLDPKQPDPGPLKVAATDRKSTRLNSSH